MPSKLRTLSTCISVAYDSGSETCTLRHRPRTFKAALIFDRYLPCRQFLRQNYKYEESEPDAIAHPRVGPRRCPGHFCSGTAPTREVLTAIWPVAVMHSPASRIAVDTARVITFSRAPQPVYFRLLYLLPNSSPSCVRQVYVWSNYGVTGDASFISRYWRR